MAKETNGYIFENNGKWYARITYRDASGTRRNVKRTAASKKDASLVLKELKKKLETQGKSIFDKEKLTFSHLADYYEQNYVIPAKIVNGQKIEGLRSLKTAKYYLSLYREFFGNKRLVEITYDNLRRFRSIRLETITKRKKTRSIAAANRELAYLRRIFNIALRQDWINSNPFSNGDTLFQISAEQKRERILTIDEEKRLLAACSGEREITYKRKGKEITAKIENGRNHLKAVIIALLDTGARKGEMLKLTWQFVDFQNRIITIEGITTKTLQTRQVAITQRLYDELQKLWANSNKMPNSLVFGITDNVRKSFESACNDAGIPHGGICGITLHSLRHSAATRLVNGNLPIQMVGRILGHTQPQTTYRYLTANNETLRNAASIFEAIQS
jgi:integrase